MVMRNGAALADFIGRWLADKVRDAHADGIVVGLSGGIDSAVVAALGRRALGRDSILALIMPCHSDPRDAEDARLVADALNVPFVTVDLAPAFDSLCQNARNAGIASATSTGFSDAAKANLKARLRMSTLYAAAQTRNALVCGTSNRSEFETGYFTKFGDSASDLLPLADLLKCEVRAVASFLGVPEQIITKAPSAGLVENQTDEGDMGFTYEQLDYYLTTGEMLNDPDGSIKARIEAMRARSAHKRVPAPICRPEV